MELPAAAAGDKNSDLRKKLEARKALNVATAGQGGTSQADGSGKNRKSGSGSGNRENGYARVDGPKISKVMQSVCLTLGRETQGAKRKAPEPPVDEQAAEEAQREKQREKTFLAIGQSASISRRHVEIVYDFRKRRWALLCLGRNGVFVDNVFVQQSDAAVPLHNKSRIEAMAEREDRSMMVGEIYQRIKDKYAFYRNQPEASWQSSIRHCLTINKCFVKIPRVHADPAHKGACWTLVTDGDVVLQQLLDPHGPPTIPPEIVEALARASAASASGVGENGGAGKAGAHSHTNKASNTSSPHGGGSERGGGASVGVGLGQAGQGQQAGEAVQDKMLLQQGGADRLFALNSETRAIGASAKGRADADYKGNNHASSNYVSSQAAGTADAKGVYRQDRSSMGAGALPRGGDGWGKNGDKIHVRDADQEDRNEEEEGESDGDVPGDSDDGEGAGMVIDDE